MRRSSCVSGVSDARDGDAGCGAERGMSLGERGAEEEETRWRREGGTRCGILVMWKCSGWVEAWWCSGCGCRYEALWPCTRVCVYGYGVDGRWMADIVYGGGGRARMARGESAALSVAESPSQLWVPRSRANSVADCGDRGRDSPPPRTSPPLRTMARPGHPRADSAFISLSTPPRASHTR